MLPMLWPELEGLASSFHDDAGIGSPVDPWVVAWALELEVRTGPPGFDSYLCGDIIYVDPLDPLERQGFAVAHECAHVMLRGARLPNTEHAANGLASCLMLPRIDIARDLRRCGGDLFALRELHRWASYEALARRVVALTTSIAWVWDHSTPTGPRAPYSIITPGQRWPMRAPLPVEIDAMHGAIESAAPVESVGGVRAWPVSSDGWERVISLSDLDVLRAFAA